MEEPGDAQLNPVGSTRVDPIIVARLAGLRYVSDAEPGITRRGCGTGFSYRDPSGETIRDRRERRRIESLAIPPAWEDVWICPDPRGHLQATGRDARGRKQYRYHPLWREVRDATKFGRMALFGSRLPGIRRRVGRDLARDGLPRKKVLASVVRLLDTSLIRIGNPRYARDNESFGLTTLRGDHVEVEDDGTMVFSFRGKSGKDQTVDVRDSSLAEVVSECKEIPGQELFRYRNGDGGWQTVESEDVNAYLHAASGYDFTAKDFRTWAGTVRAVRALREMGPAPSEKEGRANVVEAVKRVAAELGNTPATCRAFYIHPGVIDAYESGRLHDLLEEVRDDRPFRPGFRAEERDVLALLPRLEQDQEEEEEERG